MMLKEKTGGQLTVITVGDVSVESVIRKALAIGADAGVRINATPTDSYSTAKAICSLLKRKSSRFNYCRKRIH